MFTRSGRVTLEGGAGDDHLYNSNSNGFKVLLSGGDGNDTHKPG